MDKENNSTKCLPCLECSSPKVAIVECNSTQNRECGCPPGKFFYAELLFCSRCSKCPMGERVVTACTPTNDTKCQPCPKVCIIFKHLGCVRLGNPDLDFENLNPDFPIGRTLNDWTLGKQLILSPENLSVSRGGAEGNI